MNKQMIETLAESSYDAYCDAVGGTTYDGRKIPAWSEMDKRQRDGWRAMAKSVAVNMLGICIVEAARCRGGVIASPIAGTPTA